MNTMEFERDRPIFLQIKSAVKERIVRREIKKELPTIRGLAVELGVNPNTVARAYRELETEGIIGSRVGKGTWVIPEALQEIRKEMIEDIIDKFLNNLHSIGLDSKEIKEILEGINDRDI